jgi:hypothetical protein
MTLETEIFSKITGVHCAHCLLESVKYLELALVFQFQLSTLGNIKRNDIVGN